MTRHAEVLENEAMNKMTDDAYNLSLLLTEHQHTEVITRLILIHKQIRQTWRIVWKERFNAAHFQYLISEITHQHLQLHKNHAKSHSTLLMQLRIIDATAHYWCNYTWEKLTSINFYMKDEYLISLWQFASVTKIECWSSTFY